jgi:peptide/nickel transport system ATP-binding protein
MMTQTLLSPTPVTENSAPLLEVCGLTKHFPIGTFFKTRYVYAAEDVSFTANQGEVVALVGESGSGKSTTIRMVARLLEPTYGKIFFHGREMLAAERGRASLTYRSKVQMIFQDPFSSLNAVKTIGHHLERPLLLHKITQTPHELVERVEALLTSVGLNPAWEFSGKFPHELSGGQRQRVAIARSLAVNPELILADEPISMLDVSIRMGVLNLIEQLKEERGIGFVYITHDLASARYIGDRTMVMYAGRMVEGGESEELMSQPAHPYTRVLISAVPNPHAGLRTDQAVAARGEIPSLIDPPPGCPFAPRCFEARPTCREEMPPITMLNEQHWVRCHLYG